MHIKALMTQYLTLKSDITRMKQVSKNIHWKRVKVTTLYGKPGPAQKIDSRSQI